MCFSDKEHLCENKIENSIVVYIARKKVKVEQKYQAKKILYVLHVNIIDSSCEQNEDVIQNNPREFIYECKSMNKRKKV
jgi:hypothetical protein